MSRGRKYNPKRGYCKVCKNRLKAIKGYNKDGSN